MTRGVQLLIIHGLVIGLVDNAAVSIAYHIHSTFYWEFVYSVFTTYELYKNSSYNNYRDICPTTFDQSIKPVRESYER